MAFEETGIVLPPGVDPPPTTGPIGERATIVNETDLPDDQVEEAVGTYIEEHASVLGVNAGSSFQTYANSQGSLLARSKFRTPTNVIEEIALARDVAERDDDVGTTIGEMCALAFGDGMQHMHPDEVTLAMYDQVAANTNLDLVWQELYREWLISSQINTATVWTEEDFQFTPDGADRQRTRSVTAPLIGVLPAENIRVVGSDIFRTGVLALKPATAKQERWLRELFDSMTTEPRRAELRRQDPVLASLVVEALDVEDPNPNSFLDQLEDPNWENRLYRLNPRLVHRTTMPKGAWSYPRPLLTRNFALLEAKRLLNLMEYALLQGGSNYLVVAKKGSDKIPAKQQEVTNLHEVIRRASRTGVIIGDHRLEIEVITPDLKELLNEKKRGLLGRKLANSLLRVPEEAAEGGEIVQARMEIIPRILQSDRLLIRRHVETHIYEEVARRNANVSDQPAGIWFPKIILQGTQYFIDYVLKLRDRADISRHTAVSVAGFDYDTEVRKRKLEKPDDRVMTPPPVPFSSPNMGPQDNQPGRPPGTSPNNGRPGAQNGSPPASARPRQVVSRNAGETVTARFQEELGTYRIGEATEALLQQYDDTADFGRINRLEREALMAIEGGERAIIHSGATTVVPVNVEEELANVRVVRLVRALGVLVGERDDGALMARALVFREPEYDRLAAEETALRFGFQFQVADEETAAVEPQPAGGTLELHVHTAEGTRTKRIERDPETNAIIGIHDVDD